MNAYDQHSNGCCLIENNNSPSSEVENVKTESKNLMDKNVAKSEVDNKQNDGNLVKPKTNEPQNETSLLSDAGQTVRRTLMNSNCKWEFLGIGKKYVGIYVNEETFRIFKTKDVGSYRLSHTYSCCGCLPENVNSVFWKDSSGNFTCQIAPSDEKHLEQCKPFTKAEAEDFIQQALLESPPPEEETAEDKSDEDVSSDEEAQIDMIKGYNDAETDGEFEGLIDSDPVKEDDEIVKDLKRMMNDSKYSEEQVNMIQCLVDNAKTWTGSKDAAQVPVTQNVDYMMLKNKDGFMRKYEAVAGTLSCMFCMTKGKNVRAKMMSNGKIKMPKEEKHHVDCSAYKVVDISRCKFDDNVFTYGGYKFKSTVNRKDVYHCDSCLLHDRITKAVVEKVVRIEDHCAECSNPRKRVRFNQEVNVQRYKRAKETE
uniref:Uncharacterized protein n=1 Tax=Panagrolaimus sp. JU765 TaxID=591449 RepID=A0AC34Q604_9BILA